MVSPVAVVPALIAAAVAAVLVLGGINDRVNARLTRLSRGLFGRFVDADHAERKYLLQSAFVAENYGAFAAKTYLYAILCGLLGGIVGGYVVAGIVFAIPAIGELLSGLPRTMTAVLGRPSTWSADLPDSLFLGLVLGGWVAGTAVSGAVTYTMRWRLLAGRAESRRRQINESMARTVAFMYALSRGGVPFAAIMRTLADQREVYGESAREVSVAVRQMDLFGRDMINAVQWMAQRSPSEEFKTFSENLASVLQSGQSLPQFLHEQYERYQEQAEERQAELLELLATIAEAYVTILVAGTLFFITILLVFGLTTTDTLWILRLFGYLIIPLANVGFMVFLAQRLAVLGIGDDTDIESDPSVATDADPDRTAVSADGGRATAQQANFERLAVYDRLMRYKRVFGSPIQRVLDDPAALVYVTVPLAVLIALVRLPAAFTGVGVNVRVLDDIVVQSILLVVGSYAIVRFVYKRRLTRMESASPELLGRLASLNEAGMSVVESFDRVRGSDLGALDSEVDRIWIDINLGSSVESALTRFGRRVRTLAITRAVTLLTNAMRASGNIGSVLRIAATQARADLRMKRQRRRQMLTYLVVIYVAFLVFLVIIVAVDSVLVPSLPTDVPNPDSNRLGIDPSQFTRFGSVNKAAYTLVFFHIALLQAFFSGLVGGQLGEGSIRDGVKHAAIMLMVAYGLFVLLSSPVASMTLQEQFAGDSVRVEEVTLSGGGYLVVHENSVDGEVIGRSEYLPAGTSRDVEIALDREVSGGTTVVFVPHLDTNENEAFDSADSEVDRPYPPDAASNRAELQFD